MDEHLLIHPGEMLREEFLIPHGLDATQLATRLDISESTIAAVIEGRYPVDGALSQLLGHAFGMSDTFFANVQIRYELDLARLDASRNEAVAARLRRADALAAELLGS